MYAKIIESNKKKEKEENEACVVQLICQFSCKSAGNTLPVPLTTDLPLVHARNARREGRKRCTKKKRKKKKKNAFGVL